MRHWPHGGPEDNLCIAPRALAVDNARQVRKSRRIVEARARPELTGGDRVAC
ncbi:hypothetical protein ACFOW6_17860 [Fodinicurvata halophila]|uniref:Uncharacterized protein n=1 Tax=Fodinicurvata halophila TaxID=1419723 RepID=A0ABV8URN3_9PROT